MRRSLPARWRAPTLLTIATLIALAVGGASHGWNTVLYIIPIPLVVGTFLFAMAGRDGDYGAALRGERDERQALQRLAIQALVGRVLSLSVATAYIVAIASNAVLWPSAILLALTATAFITGQLVYGDRRKGSAKTPHAR
jgi:hypothetical protein